MPVLDNRQELPLLLKFNGVCFNYVKGRGEPTCSPYQKLGESADQDRHKALPLQVSTEMKHTQFNTPN